MAENTEEPVAEWMLSLGFKHRPTNHPIFWVNETGVQVYVRHAPFFYQQMLEAQEHELTRVEYKRPSVTANYIDARLQVIRAALQAQKGLKNAKQPN